MRELTKDIWWACGTTGKPPLVILQRLDLSKQRNSQQIQGANLSDNRWRAVTLSQSQRYTEVGKDARVDQRHLVGLRHNRKATSSDSPTS
jgi:hypothetical protein